MGYYECSNCGEKFPYVYGRQKLKLISVAELEKLEKSLSDAKAENKVLKDKLDDSESGAATLSSEVAELQKTIALMGQHRLEGLRMDVDALKHEKIKLEREIARIAM